MNHTSRVILLIDMDCFYCQVEENLDPNLKGKPIAVVQYNEWRGGGIIAVNYLARERGVTRHMRGDDAREKCPEIMLAKVPQVRGKANLSKYRDAGKRVADVLQTFTLHLERASVDEAYLDITEVVEKRINAKNSVITVDQLPNTFVLGSSTADFVENVTSNREYNESNFKLAVGGIIAEEIRTEVFKITGYKCSAGIAHNKILAKLVCGLHKPDKQTILSHEMVPELFEKLPIRKIKSLGGKFGSAVAARLDIEHMGELMKFSQKDLAKKFDEKAAVWLYNTARGIDMEPVNTRLVSKSLGCCKKFPGKSALLTREDVEHWLNEFAEEISERLEKDLEENNRRARQMVVSFAQEINDEEVSSTRTHPLNSYEQKKIFENGLKVLQKNCLKADGTYIITFLGISAGNFQDVKNVKDITSFFQNMKDNMKKAKEDPEDSNQHGAKTYKQVNENECTAKHVNNSSINIRSSGGLGPMSEITSNRDSSPKSDSIYSNSTEDDTDSDNCIFFEQVYPDSITDQCFIDEKVDVKENDNVSNTSEDSISQEFSLKATETDVPLSTSFFTKYFDAKISRNFGASKVLDGVGHNDLDTAGDEDADIVGSVEAVKLVDSNCDKMPVISDTLNKRSGIVNTIIDNVDIESKNSCPECGKVVTCFEYQAHLDYHFAINLVKNEAHLYKPACNKRPSTSPSSFKGTKGTKKQKQKENNRPNAKPIAEYFQNKIEKAEQEESSQSCSECKKRIRLDDWNVHMDFHAAKKLHLEMNVNKIKLVNPTKFKGQKNILGFVNRS